MFEEYLCEILTAGIILLFLLLIVGVLLAAGVLPL